MFQVSINSIQKHLSYCQKTKLLPNSMGDNFNKKHNRVIVLALCSTLHISINVPSINQFHSKTFELLTENKSRGDNFHNKHNRVMILALCSNLHIYLLMFQISINSIQKHLSYCQKTKLKPKL